MASSTGPVVYDKAKWHFGGDYPHGLPIENAFTHAGMFFGWVVDNDFVDSDFQVDFADEIAQFRERQITAGRLFRIVVGVLAGDMMTDLANAFAAAYFDFSVGEYISDYEELLVGDLPSLYHVEDSWENYTRMSQRINERFVAWRARRGDPEDQFLRP